MSIKSSFFGHVFPMLLGAEPRRWVALDCETGGLEPTEHALLSIAFCGPYCAPCQMFCCDSAGEVTPAALEINRLDLDMVRTNGLPRHRLRGWFLDITRDCVIVGHNVLFDLAFIASRLFDLKPGDAALQLLPLHRLFDTYYAFRHLHPKSEAPFADLASVASFYGVEFEFDDLHSAIGDARITAAIFQKMIKEKQNGYI